MRAAGVGGSFARSTAIGAAGVAAGIQGGRFPPWARSFRRWVLWGRLL
jgi:hypothetical protein